MPKKTRKKWITTSKTSRRPLYVADTGREMISWARSEATAICGTELQRSGRVRSKLVAEVS